MDLSVFDTDIGFDAATLDASVFETKLGTSVSLINDSSVVGDEVGIGSAVTMTDGALFVPDIEDNISICITDALVLATEVGICIAVIMNDDASVVELVAGVGVTNIVNDDDTPAIETEVEVDVTLTMSDDT